jgi:tripartite-type tricarboxylate transporter receptor subunit TctC
MQQTRGAAPGRLRGKSGNGGTGQQTSGRSPPVRREEFMVPLRSFWLIAAGLGAFLGALCCMASAAVAQGKYPSRPIRVIVPLPPGGAIDVFVRALGKEFETRNGVSVVVENRAGANTIIAANACKSAAPDGYTFCLLTRSTVSINPEIYRKLSYEPLKDFEVVTNGFFGQQIVILNKNVPVKTFAELVDYSKKNPDELNFASMGLGGDSHLIMEWLKHATGAKITHVPYKGFPEAMTSFKANDVQMIALLVGNPDLARQVREGEVKGLLLPGSTRSNLVPDVPTFAESGLSGDETAFTPWFGFFAPRQTPKEFVERMSDEINAIMAGAEFRERFLISKGLTPAGSKPEAFAKFLVSDRKAAADLVAISGVKLDE